jgi:hypothetical protein
VSFKVHTLLIITFFVKFQIAVEQNAIDHVRALYIKPDHPVFDLVPPNLGDHIQLCYEQMGHPIIDRDSVWCVYCDLLHMLQHGADDPTLLVVSGDNDEELEELSLLNNYQDLPFNEDGYYMGGVGGGLGLSKSNPFEPPV